jgi:hypothetical protein
MTPLAVQHASSVRPARVVQHDPAPWVMISR